MTKIKTLVNQCGGRYKDYSGEVGIEVETETTTGYTPPGFNYWTTHADGSLRHNGVEFVLAQPLDYNSKAYKDALAEFGAFAKTKTWLPSVYTSVHVHFNQKDRTLVELANFIVLYLLHEEILTRFCGSDRDGNLFCLKTSNAERNVVQIKQLFQNIDKFNNVKGFFNLNANNLKYAGLNIATLRTFGSLEIRTHGGTTDVELIDKWVGMLHLGIYSKAKTYANPLEILENFRKLGPHEFLEMHFEDYTKYLDTSTLAQDYEKTLWYATSVATCVDSWKDLCSTTKKERPKTFKIGKFKASDISTLKYDDEANGGLALDIQATITGYAEYSLATSELDQ